MCTHPEALVTGNCESTDVGADNETGSSARGVHAPNCGPSLQPEFILFAYVNIHVYGWDLRYLSLLIQKQISYYFESLKLILI